MLHHTSTTQYVSLLIEAVGVLFEGAVYNDSCPRGSRHGVEMVTVGVCDVYLLVWLG